MTLELYALLSVIESRSFSTFKDFWKDCLEIELLASKLISNGEISEKKAKPDNLLIARKLIHSPRRQDILLTLNAGLSRLSSQALSGTSPILKTECHFWPHSFLGIGVANYALRNVAYFVTKLVRDSKYNQSYSILLSKKFTETYGKLNKNTGIFPNYMNLPTGEFSTLKSHLLINKVEISSVDNNPEFINPNPITYYSGRDGFRNHALTTSAPLPSVSGCNSYQWNLGTITHELSHRILSGKIEDLFQNHLSSISKNTSDDFLLESYFDSIPDTVGEYLHKLLGFCLMILHSEDLTDEEFEENIKTPDTFFTTAKSLYSIEIEESLVHIFDYYHFYGSDPKLYIDFVWLSWAVQPTIIEKMDIYIKRTLLALSVQHLNSPNWKQLALDDFKSVLTSEPLSSKLKFQKDVLDKLKNSDTLESYKNHLDNTQHLLLLFHAALKSEKLRSLASTDPYKKPKTLRKKSGQESQERRKYNYQATKGVFKHKSTSMPRPSFSNPLLFLRDFSREEFPNAAESAWLLSMLAFNFIQEEPEERDLK